MINHHSSGQRRQQNEVYLLEKDAYLLCLHVKPATVFCGVIIFIMSFMNILILLSKFTIDFSLDKENANASHLDPRFKTNKLIVLYIIAESLKLLISSLLIYGVTRCKPSYLIPFFLMQLFYFFRSVSFFLENYTNMQTSYQNNNVYRNEMYDNLSKSSTKVQEVPPSYQMLVFSFSLLYKLYFITCVFKCYKYLKLKEAAFQISQDLQGSGWQFRQHQQQPVSAAINILQHQPAPPQYNEVVVKDGTDYPDQKLPTYAEACRIAVPELAEKTEPTVDSTPSNPANSTAVTINNEPNELKSPQDNRNAQA